MKCGYSVRKIRVFRIFLPFIMGKHRKVKGKLTLKFCSCFSMETDEFPEENRPYSPREKVDKVGIFQVIVGKGEQTYSQIW